MSELSNIRQLDIFCRMNDRAVVYNRDGILCGFTRGYGGLK